MSFVKNSKLWYCKGRVEGSRCDKTFGIRLEFINRVPTNPLCKECPAFVSINLKCGDCFNKIVAIVEGDCPQYEFEFCAIEADK